MGMKVVCVLCVCDLCMWLCVCVRLQVCVCMCVGGRVQCKRVCAFGERGERKRRRPNGEVRFTHQSLHHLAAKGHFIAQH